MPVDLTSLPDAIRTKCDELARDIDFSKLIDKASNGYVLIGHNKVSEQDIAIKFYYWGNGDHIEPALLARINSEFTLSVLHAESLNADYAFFMTPFCAAGDLDEVMTGRQFGPIEAVDVLCQIAGGASFLHGSGYLHRDLKLSNIFAVEAHRYVIGDFGSVVPLNAKGYAPSLTKHSLLYRPPEVITTQRFYREGDIYQLGLILFQVLGGRLPYEETAWLSAAELQNYGGLTGPDQQLYAAGIIEDRIVRGGLSIPRPYPPGCLETCSASSASAARWTRKTAGLQQPI